MPEETLAHAITLLELLAADMSRLFVSGDAIQAALISDCMEHRLQLSDKLRHLQQQTQLKKGTL